MNILLTSTGRRTYMIQYFKKALNGNGLVFASNSILTYSLLQADKYVLTPNIYDDNYISFLIEYCNKNSINVIISLFDIDLPILAKNKQLFKQKGIDVIVSDYKVTQICNDKWATYNFLLDLGLLQTPSFINLDLARKSLLEKSINYPIILKPRWGMGSIGIYKAENEEELLVFYNKLHRDIFNTYLKYESSVDINSCIIIQEAIKGQEYGIDILNDFNGNYVTSVVKKKIAMRAGETDIAEIVDNSPFINTVKLISKNLKHIANLDIDCFITEDNEIDVLEMNCRFGGQYPFSHNAGVDFPKQIIEWIKGNPTNKCYIIPTLGIISCKDLLPVVFRK